MWSCAMMPCAMTQCAQVRRAKQRSAVVHHLHDVIYDGDHTPGQSTC